jgi:hypothetical protein
MNKKLFVMVSLVNLALIAILLFIIKRAGNEHGIALLSLYYPVLIGVNLLLGIIFLLTNSRQARVFFISLILLFAMLPIFLIVSMLE